MNVRNKFYCGAKEILTNGWAKATEQEAIAHAKDLLATDDFREHVVIVKIVGIVKREARPVRYERVR